MTLLHAKTAVLALRLFLVIASLVLWSRPLAADAQEVKRIRMGYPAFSLTFVTFFVAMDYSLTDEVYKERK